MTKALQSMNAPDVLAVVFHPRRESQPPDAKHDVTLSMPDGVKLGGQLHRAGTTSPLVLFFHGNGEIASDYADIAPVYNRIGLSFLAMDYRGYGRSGGTPTVTNLVSDARAVWEGLPDLLKQQKIYPSRVYIMGRSLGSASALEIAALAGTGIAGLIIESGFAFGAALVARLGGPTLIKKDDGRVGLNHIGKIESITVPTLIIHGEKDFLIPVADGQALHDHAGASEKRLLIVPGAGHNDLLWVGQKPYFQAIRDFTDL
ncbi:MAG: alpha/beta fold hydrolase [Verrucomicrobia bacterium]|nr:alpha/beta fold hydrolase [Verrucomicrobiota bacterium]